MINYLLFTLILFILLYYISIEDVKTMLISDWKVTIFAIFGFIYSIINDPKYKAASIINLIINHLYFIIMIFTSMIIISILSYKLLGVNSLGLGDIKLISLSYLWLGSNLILPSIYISFMISSIYFLYKRIYKRIDILHQYPFAPFISIGIFSTWLMAKI